jgi:hypothetical protein
MKFPELELVVEAKDLINHGMDFFIKQYRRSIEMNVTFVEQSRASR